MRYITLLTIAIFLTLTATQAQQKHITELAINPQLTSEGLATLRNEFISYNIRVLAEEGERDNAEHYKILEMSIQDLTDGSYNLSANIDIPFSWLNREVFIQINGLELFTLSVNNESIGYSSDSRCPSQFNISKQITNGDNLITINAIKSSLAAQMEGDHISDKPYEVFIYSQPKLRIEDYKITTTPDITNLHTNFNFKIDVANSYKSDELMTVGYDIYSPDGTLLNYNMTEVRIKANGKNSVKFKHTLYNTEKMQWSETSPMLYKVMLFVKHKDRLTEYIPLKVGISNISYNNGMIYRNGKPIDIKPINYNSDTTKTKTISDLKSLKEQGFNSVIVDYPQEWWFYDICDELGVNIIDQANINDTINANNRGIGGSSSNNPVWKKHFTERVVRTIKRSSNHASIIAISLGGAVGNGYNLYKSYQVAKLIEQNRPIILKDNNGEWNSDLNTPRQN